jgi:hypothetical protein
MLWPDELSGRVKSRLGGSADGRFFFQRLSGLGCVTIRARDAGTMFVNQLSAGLALIEKRARRDDARKQKNNSGALEPAR